VASCCNSRRTDFGPLAHAWLEQRTHNPLVPCSTHGRPTRINHLQQGVTSFRAPFLLVITVALCRACVVQQGIDRLWPHAERSAQALNGDTGPPSLKISSLPFPATRTTACRSGPASSPKCEIGDTGAYKRVAPTARIDPGDGPAGVGEHPFQMISKLTIQDLKRESVQRWDIFATLCLLATYPASLAFQVDLRPPQCGHTALT
jgi:hypothetical protein